MRETSANNPHESLKVQKKAVAPRTLDSFPSVEHFLDVLAHDVVDIGQIVVQAMHVLRRVGVRVLLALLLDELVCTRSNMNATDPIAAPAKQTTHQT